jgi:hypothetical protein
MNNRLMCAVGFAVAAFVAQLLRAAQPDALANIPALKAPTGDEVREHAMAWLNEQHAEQAAQAAAGEIWQPGGAAHALASTIDRLAATFALVDRRAKALVALCAKPRGTAPLAGQDWLADKDTPAFERNNLRLYYGRWLSHERLYDESLEQLSGLEPADVVDPAAVLFFQSVAHHRLLNKTDGLKAIDRLLGEVVDGPARYITVAGLMREDLKGLEDDSLDHISRRMDDIRRRLDLGRAGEKVRTEEDGVIASLDKLIDEIEKQQQQQQVSSSGGASRPSQPMPDSRIAKASGPGNVDRKNIGRSAGWGDLPAKDREEALQQIGKDFPSHYRDIIEQYFRKLATEEDTKAGGKP